MTWFARLRERRQMQMEVAKEVAAHIEEKVAELLEAGMPEREARLAFQRPRHHVRADRWNWRILRIKRRRIEPDFPARRQL
jgi:hypothetical protein